MTEVEGLIQSQDNGELRFGNYKLDAKFKVSDFEHLGDSYKVKTFKEITKLERNEMCIRDRTYSGMLNAIGLQNPGIDVFIKRDIPFLKQFDTKIVVNVCGKTTEDYICLLYTSRCV